MLVPVVALEDSRDHRLFRFEPSGLGIVPSAWVTFGAALRGAFFDRQAIHETLFKGKQRGSQLSARCWVSSSEQQYWLWKRRLQRF
jgi:hypothetical protein